MVDIRGKIANLIFSVALLIICAACYILYILLFVAPEVFHLDSLIYPNTSTIKPTVVVGLLTAIFAGATAAFVTRCVEQSLWLRLSPTNSHRTALEIREAHHLAQWSVSPLERLFIYPFLGSSWALKFGGILLFATAAINPVLLSGISQRNVVSATSKRYPNTIDMTTNRFDVGNYRYRGGTAHDNPTLIASVAEMANLTASILDVCGDDHCHITSITTAILAQCQHTTSPNPNGIGLSSSDDKHYEYCGTLNPDMACVTLVSSRPFTYANFTSSYHPKCMPEAESCAPGVWSTLFGVWVNGADVSTNSTYDIHTVNCQLTFGNVTVQQNGTNPPTLDRDSFVQADWSYRGTGNWFQLNRIYTEYGPENSPYTFAGQAVGTGSNSLYAEPVGYYLLGEDANNDGETVARQIERNFDRATLSAYARQANASDLTVTLSAETDLYVYRPRVLLILLISFLATLLCAWGRWAVGGDDVVITYMPIEIARRGPVAGLPQGEILGKGQRKSVEKWKVWGIREDVVREDKTRIEKIGFAAGGNNGVTDVVA